MIDAGYLEANAIWHKLSIQLPLMAAGTVITELFDAFLREDEGRHLANVYGPLFITEVIARSDAGEQELTVLPADFFYPYGWEQRPEEAVITGRTVAIHHWAKSWW